MQEPAVNMALVNNALSAPHSQAINHGLSRGGPLIAGRPSLGADCIPVCTADGRRSDGREAQIMR